MSQGAPSTTIKKKTCNSTTKEERKKAMKQFPSKLSERINSAATLIFGLLASRTGR
jgi:hypothetical protein